MSEHKPSACCEGERCFCGMPASAKVEETIFHDDWSKRDDGPNGHMPPALRGRHPLTAYVCEEHFNQIMRRGRHADAILSLPALSVPEGWVAVPREPTEGSSRPWPIDGAGNLDSAVASGAAGDATTEGGVA